MRTYSCTAGEDKRKAQAFSFAAVLLAAATTYLLLRISYAQAAFQTTMSKRDEGIVTCQVAVAGVHQGLDRPCIRPAGKQKSLTGGANCRGLHESCQKIRAHHRHGLPTFCHSRLGGAATDSGVA